ncbi:MAG: hypothetical protein HFACDABA_02058 [Anaerolineales bacterium]|nr:hypothetical protein [Anaerolineales bacterium]
MNAKIGTTLSFFLILSLVLALTFGPLGASPARAATITVDSTAQEVPFVVNGNCTLGEAIVAANTDAAVDDCIAGAGSDEIFVPAGTYTLTAVYDASGGDNLGLPRITSPITITGALASTTIITRDSAAPQFRFLKVGPSQTLTLNNLTFDNGYAAVGEDGGAVNFNQATLIVNDSVFTNNRADGQEGGALASNHFYGLGLTVNGSSFDGNTAASGGAIYATLGSGYIISINNSIFTDNTATTTGGAFMGANNSVLNISDSTFEGNTSPDGGALRLLDLSGIISGSVIRDNHASAGSGGGIGMLNTGAITIANSAIVNNTAFLTGSNAYGGGITQEGTSSISLTITGSTIAGNTVYGSGGGVSLIRNTIIRNSTISGNSADSYGGGINDMSGGNLQLYNVTITGNSSAYAASAGGIHRWGPVGASVYAQNTIIAGNTNSAGGYTDCYTSGGSLLVSLGYVLLGNNTGCSLVSGAGDIVGTGISPVDARLAPLADNGGATETHALYSDSPALNAGSPTLPGSGGDSCEAADQRGVTRPQGAQCDMGAYESDGYTVTFDANGGSGAMSPQTSNLPAALTLNAFTRAGYTFTGWNTSADGSGTSYADGAIYGFAANATLYAQWSLPPNQADTFYSLGGYDGTFMETNENSGVGTVPNIPGSLLSAGDTALTERQTLIIVHFDTSSLPDNAVVTGVTLLLKRSGFIGVNPFTTHGNLQVDIASPFFGPEIFLKPGDFEAAASAANVGIFNPVPQPGNWYAAALEPAAFAHVNLFGSTQLRARFSLDDNDDLGADLVRFFSGNHFMPAYRPTLIIEYYAP